MVAGFLQKARSMFTLNKINKTTSAHLEQIMEDVFLCPIAEASTDCIGHQLGFVLKATNHKSQLSERL